MPFFNSATPFDTDVEKATHEMNTSEDWSLILDICEKVTRQTTGAKDCLKSIVKRLNNKVPFVSMQALTLLDACVNNCGRPFHLEICSRDFVSESQTLVSQKAHPKVAQKFKMMIKSWAEMAEFRDDPALNLIPSFYDSLKKEGYDFSDGEVKKTVSDASKARKEDDDLAQAIALSLQESDTKGPSTKSSSSVGASLYPSYSTTVPSAASNSRPVQKEIRKVRALYDFEAVEDNELTFKAGELICVLDDSDPNWWKGSNHRGEGLFPANFITSDLTVEPEVKAEKKTVQFNDEVEVKTLSSPMEEPEIDEARIDEVLNLIQNADPTGEIRPDGEQMLTLEYQCKAMGPLIDTELEKIDRKHANLVELNKKVMEALQMYHSLMKETPAYGYMGMKAGPPPAGMYVAGLPQAPGQPMYAGQPQYMMAAGSGVTPGQPTMAMPAQSYEQTSSTASSQQSYPIHTGQANYTTPHPVVGGGGGPATIPSIANDTHPAAVVHLPAIQSYAGGSMNYSFASPAPTSMYHPPPPQQPLL